MVDPEILLRARAHLHIVHHIPGRVRLRFAPGILNAMPEIAGAEGKDLLAGLEGIKSVRVNAAAFSLVVTYDTERLQPEWWEKLIDGSDADAATVLEQLRQLTASRSAANDLT